MTLTRVLFGGLGIGGFAAAVSNISATEPFILTSIDGAGPPDFSVYMGTPASGPGKYQGRRAGQRSLTFTIDIRPDYSQNQTVAGLRNTLYKALLNPFTDTEELTVTFIQGNELPILYTKAVTEKVEPEISSSDPEFKFTLLCGDYLFRQLDGTVITANSPSVSTGYTGTANTGFDLSFDMVASSNSVIIQIDNRPQVMRLDYPFSSGDKISMSTIRGRRFVSLTRSGTTIPILYSMIGKWPELYPTSDILRVYGGPNVVSSNYPVTSAIRNVSFENSFWGL